MSTSFLFSVVSPSFDILSKAVGFSLLTDGLQSKVNCLKILLAEVFRPLIPSKLSGKGQNDRSPSLVALGAQRMLNREAGFSRAKTCASRKMICQPRGGDGAG